MSSCGRCWAILVRCADQLPFIHQERVHTAISPPPSFYFQKIQLLHFLVKTRNHLISYDRFLYIGEWENVEDWFSCFYFF